MLALLAFLSMTWVLVSSVGSNAVVGATPPKPVILAATPSCPNPTGDDDGDGLLNGWETLGYDQDGDGTIDVNLPAMGADPKKKDIFVEIDWMEGCKGNPKSLKPSITALNKVVMAFADAPVSSPMPDIKTGINLHLDYGQGGQFSGGQAIPCTPETLTSDSFRSLKSQYFNSKRFKIFHYNIWGNRNYLDPRSSGVSEIVGDDFIVTLAPFGKGFSDQTLQAGTFMHELGHNFGLLHAGIFGKGGDNLSPNNLSIMNYLFQGRGLRRNREDGNLDYTNASSGRIPTLNEAALNEQQGLNASVDLAEYGTRWYCPKEFNGRKDPSGLIENITLPINWNCSKQPEIDTGIVQSNIDGSPAGGLSILVSPDNQWGNLVLKDRKGEPGIATRPISGSFFSPNITIVSNSPSLSPLRRIASKVDPSSEEDVTDFEGGFPQQEATVDILLPMMEAAERKKAVEKPLYGVRNFVAKLQGREVYLSWESPKVNPVFNTRTKQYEPVEYVIYRLEEGRSLGTDILLAQTKDLYFWDRTAIPGKSYFYGIASLTNGPQGNALDGRETRINLPQPIRIPPLPFSFQKSQASSPLRPLKSLLENPDFAKAFQAGLVDIPLCCPVDYPDVCCNNFPASGNGCACCNLNGAN